MLFTSKNPIPYIVTSIDVNVTYLFLKLYIESAADTDDYLLIDTLEAIPDENNQVIFYLQEFLDKRLEYDLPNWNGSAPQKNLQVCKKFKVETATMEADDIFDDLIFTPDVTERWVLLGGWKFDQFPNRALNLLPNQDSRLLTYLPYFLLDASQMAYLTYMPFADFATLDVIFLMTYEDNTTANVNLLLTDVVKYQPITIPVSFAARNYQAMQPTKPIKNISLSINISTYTFFCVDNADLQSVREIYFANYLGGFDAISCTGVFAEEVTADSSPFEHYLPYNYTNNQRQVATYNHSTQAKGKIRSGFMPKEIYQPLIKDLLLSSEVFLREGNTFLPIRITSKKQDLFDSQTYLYAFDLEFEYSNKIIN